MYKERSNNCSSNLFNIIASLLSAVSIAAVFYTGIVTAISVLIYITLILGILGFIVLLVITFCGKKYICNCISSTNLVASSVGAIITSAFALAITSLATFSIPVAILIATIAFFLVSLIISVIDLLICIFCGKQNCCYED